MTEQPETIPQVIASDKEREMETNAFMVPVRLSWFQRFVCRLTKRSWNTVASTILCRAYEQRFIDSRQMHILAKEFDPTQPGIVSRI